MLRFRNDYIKIVRWYSIGKEKVFENNELKILYIIDNYLFLLLGFIISCDCLGIRFIDSYYVGYCFILGIEVDVGRAFVFFYFNNVFRFGG